MDPSPGASAAWGIPCTTDLNRWRDTGARAAAGNFDRPPAQGPANPGLHPGRSPRPRTGGPALGDSHHTGHATEVGKKGTTRKGLGRLPLYDRSGDEKRQRGDEPSKHIWSVTRLGFEDAPSVHLPAHFSSRGTDRFRQPQGATTAMTHATQQQQRTAPVPASPPAVTYQTSVPIQDGADWDSICAPEPKPETFACRHCHEEWTAHVGNQGWNRCPHCHTSYSESALLVADKFRPLRLRRLLQSRRRAGVCER